MKVIILVFAAMPLMAQQVVGPRVPATGTYANRPTSAATNTVYIVTDDSSAGACAGGGSARSQCQWSGSAWVALGGSGGGGISALTGDVTASGSGSVTATVVKVNGVAVTGTPSSGQIITATGPSAATWQNAPSGTNTNPLQTLANLVSRTSSTVLTLLPNASASTPYGFTIGTTYNFTTNPTVTITGGSGSDTAYIYVDNGGTLTVGKNNLTMSCSGACTVVSGVTGYPEGSVHIATWTASTATWDTSGGTNFLGVGGTTRVTGSGVTWTGSAYNISGGGGGGPTCTAFTVPYTSLTAAATTQEITISSSVAALTAFGAAYFSQDTNFSGGSATALYVSMGRTGSNNYEMSGTLVPLMSGGISTPFSFTPPSPLQTSSTFNVVLAFTSVGANLNTFTAGSLSGSLCAYSF